MESITALPSGPDTEREIPKMSTLPQDGDTWLAPGILQEEEPELNETIKDDGDYSGVRVGLNYFNYLNRANNAVISGKRMHVAVSGIGRLVREHGISAARELCENAAQQRQDKQEMLSRIIKLEKIRAAIASAVAEVLQLANFGSAFSVTEELTKPDSQFVGHKKFFDILTELNESLDCNIKFFTRRPSRLFSSILENSLPRRLRASIDSADSNVNEQQEILYPLSEGALALSILESKKGIYKVPRGGDTLTLDKKQVYTISECLREAILNVWHEGNKYDEIKDRWIVDKELDGLGFFGRNGSRSAPERMDPYYYAPGNAETGQPFQVPAVPWVTSWIQTNMNSPTGGIPSGQAEAVARNLINPMLRMHFTNLLRNPAGEAMLRAYFSFDELKDWTLEPLHEQVMPKTCTMEDYNDLVRGLCQATAARARKILTE